MGTKIPYFFDIPKLFEENKIKTDGTKVAPSEICDIKEFLLLC